MGGIGTPAAKPGIILLLGAFHDLSIAIFHSTVLIRVLLAVFSALLVWITARIAADVAGPVAGLIAIAYLLTRTRIAWMFMNGTSMVFFLPTLFIGVWLFSRQRQTLGVAVLCCAALFRIEALVVLAWLSISDQLLKRRWRHFTMSVAAALLTCAACLATFYVLQRDLGRLDMGGSAAGYLYFVHPNALSRYTVPLFYAGRASLLIALEHCRPPSLAALAFVGLSLHPARRTYSAVFAIAIFLVVYLTFIGGSYDVHYFDFLVPAIAGLGAAGLVQVYRLGVSTETKTKLPMIASTGALLGVAALIPRLRDDALWALALTLPLVVLPVLVERRLRVRVPRFGQALLAIPAVLAIVLTLVGAVWHDNDSRAMEATYTQDASLFLKTRPVPKDARVLIDDQLSCGIVIQDPGWFRKLSALQYFNVQDDVHRARILDAVDYVLASKGDFALYYLRYDPLSRGSSDAFRKAMWEAVALNQPRSVYGRTLTPVASPWPLVVLKVGTR